MGKTCAICGKPSGMYPLCAACFKLRDEGKVEKCDECGEWHLTDRQCKCKSVESSQKYTDLPTSGFNKCVSCGAGTIGYAFCRNCYNKYSIEEMLQIINARPSSIQTKKPVMDCEYDDDTPCKSEDNIDDNDYNNIVVIDFNNKARCITCGKKTDGLLFCSSCYHKYKNKELLFRITNATNVELLDEDYEGRYTCKDGHIVKSKSERDIDNYLFEHGISHAYERELPYGATEKEVLHPDFYLPNYMGDGKHVYIEHWGYNENNIQYTKTKKFKMPIYEKLEVTLICTYEKTDMGKIDTVLDRKLNRQFIRLNKINYEDGTSDI